MEIVEITWIDASKTAHEADIKTAKEQECLEAKTVGYLVDKNNKRVVLAMTEFHEIEEVHYLWVIPKGMINKITKLTASD